MRTRKKKALCVLLISSLIVGTIIFVFLPPTIALSSIQNKPIILYYNYENLPFSPSQFPQIVNTIILHHFNTLMLLVFINHKPIFNQSTINKFLLYSESRNLTFVPSYYIQSLGDQINISGMHWVNLDMEAIPQKYQRVFHARISSDNVSLVSVTSPFGQPLEFDTPMNIVETYSAPPQFWFMQLTYLHYSHICSIGVWLLHNQQDYDSEKSYCLHYTDGVMVFDYSNLLNSGYD